MSLNMLGSTVVGALSDAEYQALSPADIASHATGGARIALNNVASAPTPALTAQWGAVAKLYGDVGAVGVFQSPPWIRLKVADLAADAAYAATPVSQAPAPVSPAGVASVDFSPPEAPPGWSFGKKLAAGGFAAAVAGLLVKWLLF